MEAKIKSILHQEIQSGCSVESLTNLCQKIVFDEVSFQCTNTETEKMIKELCKKLDFSIKTKTVNLPVKQNLPNPILKEIVGYSICAISYYLFHKLTGVHFIGGLAGIATGLLYNKFIKGDNALQTTSAKTIISSTVEEVEKNIDVAVNLLLNIINLISKKEGRDVGTTPPPPSDDYPLEHKFLGILKFLYETYDNFLAQPEVDTFSLNLLRRLFKKYGYELIDYTEENKEFFDSSVANISERATTRPALINERTQKCIFEGHVIFPMYID